MQPGDRGGDLGGPGPAPGEPEPQAPAAGGRAARDGEQAQPQPFRLPPTRRPGLGEHLGPGQQFAGQREDPAPDLVLRKRFSGRFRSPVSLMLRMRSSHRARRR